jgi:hypothetical protein
MPAGEQLSVSHSKCSCPVVGIWEGQMLKRGLKTRWPPMKGCSSFHIGVLAYPEDKPYHNIASK